MLKLQVLACILSLPSSNVASAYLYVLSIGGRLFHVFGRIKFPNGRKVPVLLV
jgi:hypothetical protein